MTFWVAADESENYDAGGANPPLPALATFLADLNRTGDFSRFVQAVRAEFKKSVTGGKAGGGGRSG